MDLIVFLVFVSFFVLIVKEYNHNEVVLDAVVMPETLVKSGYTGTVVAEKLLDAASAIEFKAQKASEGSIWYKEAKNIEETGIEAHMPDIQVPGAGFTLRSLLRYTRQILGFKTTLLRGEVTQSEKGFTLTLRNISDSFPAIQTPAGDDLDQLIKEYGGKALLRISQPKILMIEAFHQLEYQVNKQTPSSGSDDESFQNLHDEYFQKLHEIIRYLREYTLTSNNILVLSIEAASFELMSRYEEAIDQYYKIIELYPKHVPVNIGLGFALIQTKQYEKAIVQFQKIIDLEIDDPYVYQEWGFALKELKRYEEAGAKFQKAVEIDPENAYAYYNWGLVLIELGRVDKAEIKLQKAQELEQAQSDNAEPSD